MARKPKGSTESRLEYDKNEKRKARRAKQLELGGVVVTKPRAKRPKKTKWVQLTIDHAIQQFDEGTRHAELAQLAKTALVEEQQTIESESLQRATGS